MLKESNLKKIDEEIQKKESEYKENFRKLELTDDIFVGLACGHIGLAGILGTYVVLSPMVGYTISSMVFPVLLGIITSCATSLILNAIRKKSIEIKNDKILQKINSLNEIKKEYLLSKRNYKELNNKIAKSSSKTQKNDLNKRYYEESISIDMNNEEQSGMTLSLRK